MPYLPEFVVEACLNGVRIDTFLSRQLRNYSTWRLQRIVRAGGATIDEIPASPTDRVREGQVVRVDLFEPPDKLLTPDPRAVPILYEDAWIVVVSKPAGVIAHPGGEFQSGSLANILQHWLDQRTPRRGILRPGLVHRLDRQTSGVMVVALSHLAHRNLSGSFEEGRVSKQYLALVQGCLAQETGTINAAIGRTPLGKQVLMSCRPDAIEARPAVSRYEVVERFARHTMVRVKPQTGRNHQIRVHMAHIGHPLVADEFYLPHDRIRPLRLTQPASTASLPQPEDCDDAEPAEFNGNEDWLDPLVPLRRHALHAATLSFAHPITGVWMEFTAPLPDDLRHAVQTVRQVQ